LSFSVERQYNSALQDLMEALKLAPDNRELRRLLIRVKEECIEANKLENAGSTEPPVAVTQPESSPALPEVSLPPAEVERRKEETAL